MRFLLTPILCFLISTLLIAQRSNDIKQAIISQAHFSESGDLTISWKAKAGVDSYRVSYRTDLESSAWIIAQSEVTDTFYTFPEIYTEPVEVLIETIGGDYATGYILAGNEYFIADQQEHMLILVMDSIYNALEPLIEIYRNVLSREMISTELRVIGPEMTVPDVKEQVLETNASSPLSYLLLLGHIPVPYAGNYAVDGHDNHKGAWVADAYYGDIDGNWTDVSINNTDASRDANKNIPGDGKFDQTSIPSTIEIAVGRVDFSNLPKLNESEVELTRRYFQRNIDYRMGKIKVANRAIIDNNFNLAEGFAQGAIKSFHTFLEPDSINYDDFKQCTSKDYLFAFGAGGGSYQSAGGIISTNDLITDSIQSIFTTIFGSYFGDWDSQNNLLRASLARGTSLINAWSGRPIWYFHHMVMGKPVGQVLLNTINNNGNYYSQFGKFLSSVSLLGDPSLKMYYHNPVSDVEVVGRELTWNDSPDATVDAYTIYARQEDYSWTLIGGGPIEQTSLDLSILEQDATAFMVRPVSYIQSRSGSYYNEGIGTEVEILVTNTEEHAVQRTIYPNPASEFIRIDSKKPLGLIRIADIYGRMALETSGNNEINISQLVPGQYVLLVEDQTIPFIKQ